MDRFVTRRCGGHLVLWTVPSLGAPDIGLVLLELNLPDRDGFSVLSELLERHPAMSMVVLSDRQDRDSVARALNLGAPGFIPKSEQRKVTLTALRLLFAGGVYIPHEILECKASSPLKPKLTCGAAGTIPRNQPTSAEQTTNRCLGSRDERQEQQGDMPCAKFGRADGRKSRYRKALKVTNRTEAVIAGGELGWVLS
jgi:CheY-like chemotaxis protein